MALYGYEDQIDFSQLKYVLYIRKSTEDGTRQVKSISDQIDDCLSEINFRGEESVARFDTFVRNDLGVSRHFEPQHRTHYQSILAFTGHDALFGRATAKDLEPLRALIDSILLHWDPTIFDESILVTSPSFSQQFIF